MDPKATCKSNLLGKDRNIFFFFPPQLTIILEIITAVFLLVLMGPVSCVGS